MDPRRRREIVLFIRENTATVPWPKVQDVLLERGYSSEEILAALDDVLPGKAGALKPGRIWAGLIGAALGIALWLVLALLYRAVR